MRGLSLCKPAVTLQTGCQRLLLKSANAVCHER
jgi:hypothetical protein